mmetsp:Transcript_48765/g.115893  ORF Transcript_48765/g.115893 Transcript_48765/m.115893 type:complete len:210 (+) Transcript_48765:126-755(+)
MTPFKRTASPRTNGLAALLMLLAAAGGLQCFTAASSQRMTGASQSLRASAVGRQATLRDGWDELAAQAAKVAKDGPTKSAASGATLRDGWDALAAQAAKVAASGPAKAAPKKAAGAPAAAPPSPAKQPLFKSKVSSELEERLRREAAFDADGAPVPSEGLNPYIIIFIIVGALSVATYFELGLDKTGTQQIQQQEMRAYMVEMQKSGSF